MNSYKQFIIDNLIDVNGFISHSRIVFFKNTNNIVLQSIEDAFPSKYSIVQKCKFVLADNIETKCVTCQNILEKWQDEMLCRPCRKIRHKERLKETFNKNYGCDFGFQSSVVKDKIKQTNLEKYGVECVLQSEIIKSKTKQTNIEKYGHEHAAQSEIIKSKTKQTNIEKYGVEKPLQNKVILQKTKDTLFLRHNISNPSHNPDFIKKTKQTNLEKYGVDNVFQSDEIKKKIIQTNIEKYGVDNPMKNNAIRNKAKQTNLKKYGNEYAIGSDIVKDKISKTNIEKYGSTSPFGNSEIKNKIKDTMMDRYGVCYPYQINSVKEHMSKLMKDKFINTLPENYFEILNEKYQEYCENKLSFLWLSRSTNIGVTFLKSLMAHHNLEIKNHPYNVSGEEYDLYKNISLIYNGEIIQSDRKQLSGKEIDIWIPEKNLGIEYHGVYWHSEKPKAHIEKYNLAKEKDITLLQIFSSEWKYTPEIVLSLIGSKMGIFDDRIYARQTEVKEISNDEYKNFTNENHLQGYGNATIKIGLFLYDMLVSVMSFSKPRFDKNHEWEMVRYCNLLNTQIIGGASKLFKYFIKHYNPSSVITYADARYSSGKIYDKLGFDYSHHSNPNYFYFKSMDELLESRQKYQKHKLEKLFPDIFDIKKTEEQIMLEAGYNRVYDAGNLVFIWKRP